MGRAEILETLSTGEMAVLGRIADASNGTLFVMIDGDGSSIPAVYKPVAGERPLYDFPHSTLSRREVAAYRLSEFMRLGVVPETVFRLGPAGMGSVQRWVGPTPSVQGMVARDLGAGVVDLVGPGEVPEDWMVVLEGEDPYGRDIVLVHADDPGLAAIAVFDVLANNADRKGGHVLRDTDGRLLGIDHGLTFHDEPKLRTVLWGWADTSIPAPLLEAVVRVVEEVSDLHTVLRDLITPEEIDSVVRRAEVLAARGRFPMPRGLGPMIPWPAF